MMSPRKKIEKQIEKDNLPKLLKQAAKLHGHYCPGLAIGVMAGQFAMKQLIGKSDGLEDLMAITETNNCFSDGIQFVTGCTFGNNALVFKDLGKTAFTLAKRDGKGIRISTLVNSKEYIKKVTQEFSGEYKSVVKEQSRNPEDVKKFKKYGKKAAFAVLDLEFDKIFKVEEVKVEVPSYAPSHESIVCDGCGESIMASRIIKIENRNYCLICNSSMYMQLNGNGIINITEKK
ncbi:MAG: formylmethanofuran dehydrogenase [Cytophagia bacterium]|nr:formylmethanofuran dehydrogenase [Cytophagia bacterium]